MHWCLARPDGHHTLTDSESSSALPAAPCLSQWHAWNWCFCSWEGAGKCEKCFCFYSFYIQYYLLLCPVLFLFTIPKRKTHKRKQNEVFIFYIPLRKVAGKESRMRKSVLSWEIICCSTVGDGREAAGGGAGRGGKGAEGCSRGTQDAWGGEKKAGGRRGKVLERILHSKSSAHSHGGWEQEVHLSIVPYSYLNYKINNRISYKINYKMKKIPPEATVRNWRLVIT